MTGATDPTGAVVRLALHGVLDPEIGQSIVDLGLVQRIEIAPQRVHVVLIPTSAACPMSELLFEDATGAVQRACPARPAVNVVLDWDTAWEPHRLIPALQTPLRLVSHRAARPDAHAIARPSRHTTSLHRKHFMTISSFDDLLRSAGEQNEPQRLLFVFAAAAVPDDATPEQRARFQAGQGGTLTPLMCVDKTPDELASFDALLEESRQFDQAWDIVFVAAMSGSAGLSPTSAQAEAPLQRMVESIKSGSIGGFIPFDGQGQPVQFD